MSRGGYCEIHGPYDPAALVCPACVEDGRAAPPRMVHGRPKMGPAAFGYLIVKSPVKYRGRVFRIEPGQVIGRREGDILINDRLVSRQHARINLDTRSKPPVFSILDFGTPNGTYVNHRRIDGPQPIEENDEIRLGDHIFVFKMLLHPREEQSQAG